MKITDLEELHKLRNEIKQLEKRIAHYSSSETNYEYVADTAKDYTTGYGRNIVITGYSDKSSVKVAELKQKLIFRLDKLRGKVIEVECFIDTIEESEIRQIIGMRCVEGKTWEEIGKEMGMERTTVSKKYRNFLNVSRKSRSECDTIVL